MIRPIGTTHAAWLDGEADRLLRFATAARHPDGGFAWLDERGHPVPGRDVELWITCRMTHVFALGALLGFPGAEALVDHGVDALQGRFRDERYGGWYAAVGEDGPTATHKGAYEHAFVLLAASSASVVARPGAEELLADALAVQELRFWDEAHGAVVDVWNRDFTVLEDYRGANANMHTVEAYLAASDVTGDRSWLGRARRILDRFLEAGRVHGWRLPEHFGPRWEPLLEYNRDEPAHPFRPYGATVGHALEWARLAVHVWAAGGRAAEGLVPAASMLFDRAVTDGWWADGRPGFVYTTDWQGRPVVASRLHWVVTEAINAAAALHQATGDDRYATWYRTWWDHAERAFLDHDGGSWHHELDVENRPAGGVWSGKPDIYHALQATLVPRLPLTPSLASALAQGALPATTA
jgi:sulfoquinovose isomerase